MSSGASKRVLIADFSADGHHPFYVRLLLESGIAEAAQLILAARPEMFAHPAISGCRVAFQAHQLDIGADAYHAGTSSPIALLRRSWIIGQSYRRAFFQLAARAPVDFVIVPYLDDCLVGLAAPRRTFADTPWCAITMRTMFHYRDMGVIAPEQRFVAIRRWLTYRMLRQPGMAALLTIDPTLAEFAAAQPEALFRKIQYLPDPAPQHSDLPLKEEARRRLDIPMAASVVLVYGDISKRKGILSLLEAAAAPECPPSVHLLFAGRIRSPDALRNHAAWQALAAQGRMHAFDGFVDEPLERSLIAAADCMWVGYIDFYGVSSVMALAGRHALPVLASDYGLVGHLARKHALGALIAPRQIASIVTALNQLVSEPEFFVRAGRNGVALFDGHSPVEMQQRVTHAIEQAWAT
jgi:glycosyltransferase involved in cell wall biosynthesis